MYTLLDLFAGAGGMTAGFVRAGFSPSLAVEIDRAAAATYAMNFGENHVHHGDIAELDGTDVPEVDVVIGGPPCQGFSTLGSRDIDDPRNRLWREYVRIVLAARPKMFLIENVGAFLRSREFKLLRHEVEDGALKDYEIVADRLNAADYGVPQKRVRAFVMGSRIGSPEFPEPSRSDDNLPGVERWLTVRDGIEHVPEDPPSTKLPAGRTIRLFGEEIPGPFLTSEIHIGRNPWCISLERYDRIPPGGGRFDLPEKLQFECWRRKPNGTSDVMGRMQWDRPSPTIRTEFFKPEKGRYLHPQWEENGTRVNRPITHREAALLQDFDDDYLWCGTKIQIARQIGNAVPPALAQAIAETMVRQLEEAKPSSSRSRRRAS